MAEKVSINEVSYSKATMAEKVSINEILKVRPTSPLRPVFNVQDFQMHARN